MTSIEFALLAMPFLVLLFMILELAIVFYINAALDHAASQATRLVRTGQLQMASTAKAQQQTDYLDKVCEKMAAFKDCEKRVRVDLVRSTTSRFQPGMLPVSPRRGGGSVPTGGPANGGPGSTPPGGGAVQADAPASTFEATCPGDVVMVRTEYYHGLTIPGKITFLSNAPDNHRVLTSVTAFRNEPYPAPQGSSCGAGGGNGNGNSGP